MPFLRASHFTNLYRQCTATGLVLTLSAGISFAEDRPSYIPGEIIIGMKRSATGDANAKWSPGKTVNLLSLLGSDARVSRNMSSIDGILVSTPSLRTKREVDTALARLNKDENVYSAERNLLFYATGKPSDPRLNEMWFLKKISAFNAWNKRSTSPGIIVAVLDTGIQLDHDDLKDSIWKNAGEIPDNGIDDDFNGRIDDVNGWNFVNDNANPTAVFFNDCENPNPTGGEFVTHGTHVAGTIGAIANNDIGITGISHKVQIMALRILKSTSCKDTKADSDFLTGTLDNIILGIAYALQNGAKIINMSFSAPPGYPPSKILRREIKLAIDRGVSVVVAAGNHNNDNDIIKIYPASYPIDGLISVAATDKKDNLAKFSQYGKNTVDIAAPGTKILSTIPEGTNPKKANSGYGLESGTSMAAPIVAGAIALMRAENPALDPVEIERRLIRAVDLLPQLKSKVRAGGRLNLAKLLREATEPLKKGRAKRSVTLRKEITKQSLGGIRIEGGTKRTLRPAGQKIPKSGNISGIKIQ